MQSPRSEVRGPKSRTSRPGSEAAGQQVETECTMRCVEDIQAWQKARALVREIYKTCEDGKLKRDFGLRDQLCRAAVSSMSNVAEGFARKSDREFARFLDIARASVTEVQSLLYVACDIGYVPREEFDRLFKMAAETASLIGGLTSYLRRGQSQSPKSAVRTPVTKKRRRGGKPKRWIADSRFLTGKLEFPRLRTSDFGPRTLRRSNYGDVDVGSAGGVRAGISG